MDEVTTVEMCHQLLQKYNVFAGGSSGSAYGAIKKYFSQHPPQKSINVMTIFPDKGERYFTTIYDESWNKVFIENQLNMEELSEDNLSKK